MKKILTVLLVLTLSVAGLFAVDFILPANNTITLNAKVDENNPDFDIAANTSTDFSGNLKSVDVGDPAQKDIDVYVKLWQKDLTRYSKTLKLEVTGNEFELKTNAVVKSAKPSVAVVDGTLANDVLKVENGNTAENVYTADLSYKAVSPVDANTQVLQLHFHWNQDTNLQAGEYKSTIVVKITDV